MRVPQLRHELLIRRQESTGTKESLRQRLHQLLDAELQCEVELRPGEWHRAQIQSIDGEDVALRVKRQVMKFNKFSPKLRQHLVAPPSSSRFADVFRLDDSEKAEIAYRLHRDALWRQENHGGTAEEARHQSGLKLGLPPESLPLSRSRGTGGRVQTIRPRVDIYSETADKDDSADEDEPLFLDRPAPKTRRSINVVSLHQTSIGFTNDQRADKKKMQAMQELGELNAVVAESKNRSFRGKYSHSATRKEQSNSISGRSSPAGSKIKETPKEMAISAVSVLESNDEDSSTDDKMDGVAARHVTAALSQHADKHAYDHVELAVEAEADADAMLKPKAESEPEVAGIEVGWNASSAAAEQSVDEHTQPRNTEATVTLEYKKTVAERAQQQVQADPAFDELAGLLGGLSGSDSDASSESAESEDHDEKASPEHPSDGLVEQNTLVTIVCPNHVSPGNTLSVQVPDDQEVEMSAFGTPPVAILSHCSHRLSVVICRQLI